MNNVRLPYTPPKAKRLPDMHRFVRPAILGAIALLVVTYVGVTNNVATQGYRLQAQQKNLKELQEQQTSLELDVAAAESLQRLEATTGSLALVSVSNIEYLEPITTAVAVR